MADGPLAAALRRIRKRQAISYASPRAMAESGADVPVLLAAVDAVLEVHALTERGRVPCASHARDGWDALCPKCKEYDGCAACSEGRWPAVRPEECETRQAITRALLGEES